MKLIGRALLLAIVLLAGLLLLAPTRLQPVTWNPSISPSLQSGPYAGNDRLKGIERLATGTGIGPETIGIGNDGRLYTGYADGRVASLAADGSDYRQIANTGGRPLSVQQHPDGSLIVADAWKGLLRVGMDGKVTVLSAAANGLPFGFTDYGVLDQGGHHAYFSDATAKWHYGQYQLAILEHGGDGRLLQYDFASGSTTVLLSGLQFANGVAMGPDDAYVLVNETGNYRVTRYWLKGDKVGSYDVFIDNMPCFPDNLTFNGRDRFWVACPEPRNLLVDRFAAKPFVRTMISRLLPYVQPPLPRQSIALGFDLDGRLVANLQYTSDDAYSQITHVVESGQWLYFGSLAENSIGRMARPMDH